MPIKNTIGFEDLSDIVVTVEPIPMVDGTVSYLPDPVGTATLCRWEAELCEDHDLLVRLMDQHPRAGELSERVVSAVRSRTLHVGVLGEYDVPAVCVACDTAHAVGDRALMVDDTVICLPCVRLALDGVDLD